jgi:hypothetical protein
MICHYCKRIDFFMMDPNKVSEHLATCSKEYVDTILKDAITYMRAYMGMAPHMPADPPLKIHNRAGGLNRLWVKRGLTDRRKDIAHGRRLAAGDRRVDRTRTLYIKKGLHGFEPAGMYEDMKSQICPDRREGQRRGPKIYGRRGRRTAGPERRKNV